MTYDTSNILFRARNRSVGYHHVLDKGSSIANIAEQSHVGFARNIHTTNLKALTIIGALERIGLSTDYRCNATDITRLLGMDISFATIDFRSKGIPVCTGRNRIRILNRA